MVQALHAAGIEVILDVVYNHTAEGGADGPTLSFRGLDNAAYYRLAGARPAATRTSPAAATPSTSGDPRRPAAGHSTRCATGSPRCTSTASGSTWRPALARDAARRRPARRRSSTAVGQDPVLRHGEADRRAVGRRRRRLPARRFPPPWAEWNDRYRDTVRDFWRGRTGHGRPATSPTGSPAPRPVRRDGRSPYASVNFVTAHDGFTLRDLVSYDRKHNEANGEDNRDGTDNNLAGTAASRARPTTPRSSRCAARHDAQPARDPAALDRRADARAGDERVAPRAATTTPTARTTRSPGSTGTSRRGRQDLLALDPALLDVRREHPALRQTEFFDGRPVSDGRPADLVWLKSRRLAHDRRSMARPRHRHPGDGAVRASCSPVTTRVTRCATRRSSSC